MDKLKFHLVKSQQLQRFHWLMIELPHKPAIPMVKASEPLVSHGTIRLVYSCSYLLTTVATRDLREVYEVVHEVTDWKTLGLELGLYQFTLERISVENHGKINDCKKGMLSAWLRQQDGVSEIGVPSWSVLQDALGKIGEKELASRLASRAVSGYMQV